MDKRKNDRLAVNPITRQLVNFIVDNWAKKVIKQIQFERSLKK